MGQKVNPTGFRLIFNKRWKSRWFANKKDFATCLLEDQLIRKNLIARPCCQGTAQIIALSG